MSNNLDDLMGKLKKQYDDMPTQSSTDQIMAQIKKEKKPRWAVFFRQWQAVAMIIAALGIGAILTLNEFNLGSQRNESNSMEKSDDMAVSMSEIPEADANKAAISEESALEGAPAESKNTMMVIEEEVQTKTMTIPGGERMEESINVKRVMDETLGFTTFIDEQFETEIVSNEERHSFEVYANFTGTKIEPFMFSVTEYKKKAGSVAEVADYVKGLHEDYDVTEDRFFSTYRPDLNLAVEMMFISQEQNFKYVGIFEREGRYFVLTTNLFGEEQEAFQKHLSNIVLPEFKWTKQ